MLPLWSLLPVFGFLLPVEVTSSPTIDPCISFTSSSFENTTITNAFYQEAGTNFSTSDSVCGTPLSNLSHANVCRIQGFINTTSESSLKFEAWLPDTWYGRFIRLGNGGLDGCMTYRFSPLFCVYANTWICTKALIGPASTTLLVFTLQQ